MNTKIYNLFRRMGHPLLQLVRDINKTIKLKKHTAEVKKEIQCTCRPKVLYLGITAHSNLGDMGQHFCIKSWINENYPDHKCIGILADAIVDRRFGLLKFITENYKPDDIIIFQSGYTTQDLGGVHDLMHRMVCQSIPYAKILMMPQTVFFKEQANQTRSAKAYSCAQNMLFLARDKVSFETAKEMMPQLNVVLYPDIVTTLIGKYTFQNKREGICMCIRNDGEKFYNDSEIDKLQTSLMRIGKVVKTDTTIKATAKEILKDLKGFIERQIQEFAKYEVVLTDRYHGTIFALAAGTPVVIIKTNDHKVVTGADWFVDIYNDYVHVADNLDDAIHLIIEIKSKKLSHTLMPFFKEEFYDKLKDLFESTK